jgi:phosphoserine phosphatase SerB
MLNTKNKRKLIIFDMDGTLLRGRSILFIAEKKGFRQKVMDVIHSNKESYEKSIEIASFLKGMNATELLHIFRTIPLQNHVETIVQTLKNNSIKTAIATDSYQFFANDLKNRLHFDFAFANNLIIKENIVTGEIVIHNTKKQRCDSGKIYSICKSTVLENLCKKLQISSEEVIAVGDGMVDIGMIAKAGLGIAFNASPTVQTHADVITNDLRDIIPYV